LPKPERLVRGANWRDHRYDGIIAGDDPRLALRVLAAVSALRRRRASACPQVAGSAESLGIDVNIPPA
jgi:hypothetical protein